MREVSRSLNVGVGVGSLGSPVLMVKVDRAQERRDHALLRAVGVLKQHTDRGGRFWLLPKTRAAAVAFGCTHIGTAPSENTRLV